MHRFTPLVLLMIPGMAAAATYQVGPSQTHKSLDALFNAVNLAPGDVVNVDAAVYAGGVIMRASGTRANPIVIHGVPSSNGMRPRLNGGANTIEFRLADHVVFEGFEVTGGTSRCVYHHSDDLTLRDVVVHACPGQGIASSDQDSGSLTIEYSEVYDAGSGVYSHPLYIASDEVAHPGSVFRLRNSYIHNGNGGNLVKSRAERNEIYYNWLEGSYYRELELIGPDPAGAQASWNENLVREDSDVVGNVIVHTSSVGANVVRLGGDGGGGQTNGRYRFVNNTIMFRGVGGTVFQPYAGIESIEMDNNVISGDTGSPPSIVREDDAAWVGGISRITGANNWTQTSATYVPSGWRGTFSGTNPGFSNNATYDFRPSTTSPLLDRGTPDTVTSGFEIANPLFPPAYEPALRIAPAPGAAPVRARDATIDIGAFEFSDGGGSTTETIFANGFDG